MTTEPIFDVAHLAHVELLTPKLEESARFFMEVMGMIESGRKGTRSTCAAGTITSITPCS